MYIVYDDELYQYDSVLALLDVQSLEPLCFLPEESAKDIIENGEKFDNIDDAFDYLDEYEEPEEYYYGDSHEYEDIT